jgi:hemerythrin superfamily protein
MNAIDLLKQQHDEVEELFEQFDELGENAFNGKQQIFVQIADRLAAHASIEEKFFYPAVKEASTEDLLKESVEEHLSIKRLLADLLDLPPSDEQFDAKVLVLKEQVEHHVEEEEGELFPKVRKLFETQALEDLGIQMEMMFEELLQSEPRSQVPAETDVAAPI